MACAWQIMNKKVAIALLALSIYGLLLVFVSSNNMNPRFLITSLKNGYLMLRWAGSNNTNNLDNITVTAIGNISLGLGFNNFTQELPPLKGGIKKGDKVATPVPSFIYDPSHGDASKRGLLDKGHATTITTTTTTIINTTTSTFDSNNSSASSRNADTPALIVLFTTFRNSSDKTHIYDNTMRNWQLLNPWIQPVLYTIAGELDLSAHARRAGWDVYTVPRTSKQGVPILRHMFLHAQEQYPNATYYGYANGDILFTMGLRHTLEAMKPSLSSMKQVLIVGRRTNFQLKPKQQIKSLGEVERYGKQGKLFATNAQDYFISTKNGYPWKSIPDFVVGRVGYDNWLVVTALVRRMYTVDTTLTVLALHQTGSDGNYAGHRKKPKGDTYINYGLAGKKFDYSLGHVSCGQFYTKLEKGKPVIVQRTRNGCERTFKRFHVNPYLSIKKQRKRLLL